MIEITRQQALDRWEQLTDRLREALFDEDNVAAIDSACQAKRLTEPQRDAARLLAGDALMGFIAPNENAVAAELAERLAIDRAASDEIAAQVWRTVLLPLRDELERVYSPVKPTVRERIGKSERTVEVEPITPRPEQKTYTPPTSVSIKARPVITEREPAPQVVSGSGEGEPMPFILHEERSDAPTGLPGARPSITFAPTETGSRPAPKGAAPSKAKVQLPGEPRVVHYSEFKTPLDTDANNAK